MTLTEDSALRVSAQKISDREGACALLQAIGDGRVYLVIATDRHAPDARRTFLRPTGRARKHLDVTVLANWLRSLDIARAQTTQQRVAPDGSHYTRDLHLTRRGRAVLDALYPRP